MNNIFKILNKSKNGIWVISENEKEALEIALKFKHIRKINNGTVISVDNKNIPWFDFFNHKGNDMTEVKSKKGVGCVHYKGGNHKGKWYISELKNINS